MEILYNISPEILLILTISNFALIILLTIYALGCGSKIKRLKNKYNRFMNGTNMGNLEELLIECVERIRKTEIKDRELENKINSLEYSIMNCIQKVGIVRFNAFDDMGSDLSFSIALLNDNDDGIVLSSIYSRESSCTYAKPIVSGNSKYPLSAEEMRAIDIAIRNERALGMGKRYG